MSKEKHLETLRDLIQSLKKSEKATASRHLIAYQTNHTIHNHRMLKLFNYAKKKENELYFDKAKKRVSPLVSDESFNRLITRTIDRVRESLIVEVNLNRRNSYSEIFRRKFQIRKKLMQAHILEGRGLVRQALEIYKQVIRVASKFELYDELIESKSLKTTLQVSIDSRQDISQNSKDIQFYENCRIALRQTRELFNEYSVISSTEKRFDKRLESLEGIISKVEHHSRSTNSSNIKSFYYLLIIEYYNLLKIFSKVVEVSFNMIDLVNSSPALYSINRVSYLKFSIAEAEFFRFNFEGALVISKESIQLTKRIQNINYIISVRYYLYSMFFLGMKNKLSLEIEKTLSQKVFKKFKLEEPKIIFLQSVNCFLLKDFKETNRLLSKIQEFEKDKEGWNIWIRILRIMCSFELSKFDLLEYEIESFRKFIQRTEKRGFVRKRDSLIAKILIELNKNEFDFEIVSKRKKRELNMLSEVGNEYAWDLNSAEFILFHEWYNSKYEKRTYSPDFNTYFEFQLKEESNIKRKIEPIKF